MKTRTLSLVAAQVALLSALSVNALASTDSYRNALIPVAQLQEPGYCMADRLLWDGVTAHGSAEVLAVAALEAPMRVFNNMEDSNLDVNALSETGIQFQMEIGDDDQYSQLTIDVAPAFVTLPKAEALKASKLAIYAGVRNAISLTFKQVRVKVVGLPAQQGPKPIPASFSSAFSASSPYLKQLASELKISARCTR